MNNQQNASEQRAKRRREGGGVADPFNANEQERTETDNVRYYFNTFV